jgi:tetratricopeptide (TPR) repeat protein
MKTIDFSYFIERYNAGEMDEIEKQWFRKELEMNKLLRDEVGLRSKTDAILNDHGALLLRNKLRAIEKQRAEASLHKAHRKHMPVRYAAVIAIFILLGSVLLFRGRNLPPDEILDRFYTPFEGISASRSVEKVGNRDYTAAMEYYTTHDYAMAAVLFSKVLKENPEDMESTLLYGVSNFEEKKYPVAEHSFNKVVDNNDNLFIDDARWYLALCYIQTNETEKAIGQLEVIGNSESSHKKDARKILRRIR